jgi:hypothetical protein
MKINEFITEASIFSNPKQYNFGHKVRVKTAKAGIPLMSGIQSQIPDFDPTEDLTWIAPPMNIDAVRKEQGTIPVIQIGRATSGAGRWFSRPNGTMFTVIGADGSLQGMLNHAPGEKGSTSENAGDASEPVLSAAVVAKLIKRGANNVEDITDADVKEVLTRALTQQGLTYTVTDKNSRVADKIEFTIRVKQPTMEYLLSDDFWVGYEKFLPSVVHYANSGQMDRYADYFYKNGKADVVRVVSDGVSDATTRKTDIEAYVTGDDGQPRKLSGLNVSLKAGSPHIGQVGGGQINNPNSKNYVLSNAQELFGPFGVGIAAPKKVNSKVEFWVNAYKQAAKQLKEQLKGADSKSEAGVVYRIANFVTSHATKGDPDIRLVSLGTKGVSSIHSFRNIEKKMSAEHINLDCEYRQGTSKTGDPRPEIRIFDKPTGNPLIYIRYSSTQDETKVWNTVEMKDLLKELTTLKYYKTTPRPAAPTNIAPTPTGAPVTAPAASPKATPTPAPMVTKPTADYTPPEAPEYKEPEDELRFSESTLRPRRGTNESIRQRR